jgi:mRNA interferase MazF
MAKGDIVLVTFPYTDLTGTKLRPAVILTETDVDITACFITTQLHWQEPTDLLLNPSYINGLKKQSLIRTGKISTLSRELVQGLLGELSMNELDELNQKLKTLLQLN